MAKGNAIVSAMTENKGTFVTPNPALALVSGHLGDLQTAQANVQTHAVGLVAIRDAKKAIVVTDMRQLRTYVQQLVDANPAEAETIATQAAMTLRKSPQVHKSDLAVKHLVSGSVQITAKAVAGAHAHEWQFSVDGGKTWTSVPASLQAHTTIVGLQVGVMTQFRHRDITKSGPGDWSQPISALVA